MSRVGAKTASRFVYSCHNYVEFLTRLQEYVCHHGERFVRQKSIGNGLLNAPAGICIDRRSHLVVCDQKHNRIQVFTQNGEFVGSFGEEELRQPKGLFIDSEDRIWVCDSFHDRVCVYVV